MLTSVLLFTLNPSGCNTAFQSFDCTTQFDTMLTMNPASMTNHQRIGSVSNSHAGREFEAEARAYFAQQENLHLLPSFSVAIGVAGTKKPHSFDLGNQEQAVLVECKSHNWTVTGNMPSAKVTVWNEAMYYFHLAPVHFKKILFVLEARHERQTETLAEYYVRTNGHLVPEGVVILEYNPHSKVGRYVIARARPQDKRR